MSITVGELKNLLEGLDEDMEVRFASQPNWPFEYSIKEGQTVDLNAPDEDEANELEEMTTEERGQYYQEHDEDVQEVFYLVEGNQIGYLPGTVVNAIGWGR